MVVTRSSPCSRLGGVKGSGGVASGFIKVGAKVLPGDAGPLLGVGALVPSGGGRVNCGGSGVG